MLDLDGYFYHGSTICTLDRLDVNYSSDQRPFGKAIYLSKDKVVANCYAKDAGVVYCVMLHGKKERTINLDAKVEVQSEIAVNVIRRLSKIHYKDSDVLTQNSREVIHKDDKLKEITNTFLRNAGIWMIYGHLQSMEDGGLMDRGVQYAVLDNRFVTIARKLSRQEIYG